MYRFIDKCASWGEINKLDETVYHELKFWLANLQKSNGFSIKINHLTSKIVYTDASSTGYGGYIVQRLGNIIAQGKFTEAERSASSTYREHLAIKYVLQSVASVLKNDSVQWFSDNINVSRIIQAGSSKLHLHKLAIEIFNICIINDINLQSTWIPWKENVIADSISKYADSDNWSADNETFSFVQNKFGRFTVDRIAEDKNAKVEKFNSKYHCPNTAAVNAFTENWSMDFNWLSPPINLIGQTIKHMKFCNSSGVLTIPKWHSAYFCPMITPNGHHFYDFVTDYAVLYPFYNSSRKSVFDGFAKFRTLALHVDFIRS